LSLALTALSGLVLNWIPGGLRPQGWAVFLAGLTVGACAIAWRRRERLGQGPVPIPLLPVNLGQAILLASAATLAVAAVLVARAEAERQPEAGFTQLWMLPAEQAPAVRLGVRSLEPTPATFHLQLLSGGRVVREWPAIRLERGQQWEADAPLPGLGSERVEAVLYRDAAQDPYRRVGLSGGTSGPIAR
jgi:hypothetical protein